MPSLRSRFEFACRVGAFAALGLLLGFSLIPPATHGLYRVHAEQLPARLAALTRAPASVAVHADLAVVPEASIVEWLAALQRGGRAVTWSGTPPAVAMSIEPLANPNGGVRIDVAAPKGSTVRLRDSVGVIDSLRVAGVGATAAAPIVVGSVTAIAGNQKFGMTPPDSARVRSVVVIGDAGWEGKFIVSALEESGWPVTARFSVAPKVDVSQGSALVFDTSRVTAVVAVDTSVGSYGAALDRYVRSGGGLILAGAASTAPSIAMLSPGTLGNRLRATLEPLDTISLGSTGFYPVSSVRQDAVVLDRRPLGVAVAARRIDAGRVLQVGYDDSWRWRMAGGPGSERAHRDWWARVVGAVAYVPASAGPTALGESAPLARLLDELGPPHEARGSAPRGAFIDTRILIAILFACLVAEWASRRTRGLK